MRLITGLQAVREAIRVHGDKLEKVFLVRDGGPQIDAVARFAEGRGSVVSRIDRLELDRMARRARHQGAIAHAPDLALVPLELILEGFAENPHAVVVALDEIEDPQNFGAVIRSAVALGATAILWPEHHAAPLSPATFRASAGAVEHAMLCRVAALPRALERLAEAGANVIGLDAHAELAIEDLELTGPVVLVVGAEGKGLRGPVKKACTTLGKLGMKGPIGSLNASVAAGIALYTVLRRRT
ncbi:MAG TPA: 23S rRNA (guanosine(2251)-2'-O)-methyltransferase RlmB [Labilithrix sp.]|nr:23S rRNA (guanosine(2251)-2'-O)-methyltransferase RlmB [Labilithrix sp.]